MCIISLTALQFSLGVASGDNKPVVCQSLELHELLVASEEKLDAALAIIVVFGA